MHKNIFFVLYLLDGHVRTDHKWQVHNHWWRRQWSSSLPDACASCLHLWYITVGACVPAWPVAWVLSLFIQGEEGSDGSQHRLTGRCWDAWNISGARGHECTLSFQIMQDGTCRRNPALPPYWRMASAGAGRWSVLAIRVDGVSPSQLGHSDMYNVQQRTCVLTQQFNVQSRANGTNKGWLVLGLITMCPASSIQ